MKSSNAMKDFSNTDRLEKFVIRTQVVAITQVPQRDEPPGRAPFRQKEIVLVEDEKILNPNDLNDAIKEVAVGL